MELAFCALPELCGEHYNIIYYVVRGINLRFSAHLYKHADDDARFFLHFIYLHVHSFEFNSKG